MSTGQKIGRNEPCPCGSGRKYKKCCGVEVGRQVAKDRDSTDGWVSRVTAQQRLVHPGGVVTFGVGQSNATMAVGLTNEGADWQFSSLDHAFLFSDDGTFQIYERGVAVNTPRPYTAGNLFGFRVIEAAGLDLVSYVKNNQEIHATRDVAPRFPLAVRALFTRRAAKIIKATFTDFNPSDFEAIEPVDTPDARIELSREGPPINPLKEVGFNIYRSTDPNLPKSQWVRLNDTLLTETSFVHKAVESGVAYYYYVTSVNAYGIESYPSDVIGGVNPSAAPPELTEAVEKIKKLTPELIDHLRRHEDDLIKVNPRVFEHLIAEFFASWGFDDVRLVGTNPRTSADIYVVKTVSPVGVENRYFIEVKRWKHKVGIEVINQVLGAMIGEREQFGWHAAMIVSVAGFTEFEKWDRQQLKMKGIELKDKSDLLRWLHNYKPNDNGLWLPEPLTLL